MHTYSACILLLHRTCVAWVVFWHQLHYVVFLFYFIKYRNCNIHTYVHMYVCTCVYYSSCTWCFTLPGAVGVPRASHTSNSSNSWKGRCHMLHPGHHVTRTFGVGGAAAGLPLYVKGSRIQLLLSVRFLHLLGMHLRGSHAVWLWQRLASVCTSVCQRLTRQRYLPSLYQGIHFVMLFTQNVTNTLTLHLPFVFCYVWTSEETCIGMLSLGDCCWDAFVGVP